MIHVPSKQPDLKLSVFAIMSRMAREYDAINLSQGFPDFDVPDTLVELVHHFMKEGYNQYAPMPGVEPLREAISEKIAGLYDHVYGPEEEVTVTAGATEALFSAITAVVHPGDEVIIFEPWYDAYVPVVEYNRGVPRFVQLVHPDYHIDWEMVQDAVTPKTKAIILNSPHNPTGAVLSRNDLTHLAAIVRDTDIVLISDEVYEHIVFDGLRHFSLSSLPELAARSFVISSFGKTYHATGWKVGYCMAPSGLMKEFRKVHQFITYAVNTPVQYAYARFMREKDVFLELAAFYEQKRDFFRDRLKASRFRLLPCSGTYFQLADYSEISDQDDMAFIKRLAAEIKVAAIPTSPFYRKNPDRRVIRFCFAKKEETIEKAAERLCRI